jgi:hypothetical protein
MTHLRYSNGHALHAQRRARVVLVALDEDARLGRHDVRAPSAGGSGEPGDSRVVSTGTRQPRWPKCSAKIYNSSAGSCRRILERRSGSGILDESHVVRRHSRLQRLPPRWARSGPGAQPALSRTAPEPTSPIGAEVRCAPLMPQLALHGAGALVSGSHPSSHPIMASG